MRNKKYTLFRPRIRSRHPSHSVLRKSNLKLLPFKSVVRLGSTTDYVDTTSNGGLRIELNTIQAIKNSSSKFLMKKCFSKHKVKTAPWWVFYTDNNFIKEGNSEFLFHITELEYPIIAKSIFGSRGKGNYKLNSVEELEKWMINKNLSNYIFEKFYNFNKEYRLHINENECFYTCRKMLKSNIPKENRWYRNDTNSVWILENNPLFDKPINWEEIEKQSILALNAVGLDFGAVDLKIQSSINKKGIKRENPEFIVIEINSAPSFGNITTEKYITEIPKMLINKYNKVNG